MHIGQNFLEILYTQSRCVIVRHPYRFFPSVSLGTKYAIFQIPQSASRGRSVILGFSEQPLLEFNKRLPALEMALGSAQHCNDLQLG
jgi:hypothetical protein